MPIIANTKQHLLAPALTVIGGVALLALLAAFGPEAHVLKNAFDIKPTTEFAQLTKGLNDLVNPFKSAAFAVAPLGAMAGAASLAIGNRRGVALGVTAFGGALLVAAVQPIIN